LRFSVSRAANWAAAPCRLSCCELLDQLAHHLVDQLARHRQHLRVHQVLGAQHRLQQRRVRRRALQHVEVGHHFVDAVALDRVALQALDRLLREQLVDAVDPLRHRQLRGFAAAMAIERVVGVAPGL